MPDLDRSPASRADSTARADSGARAESTAHSGRAARDGHAGRVVRTVGFDLDMTLADTRKGIAAVYDALAAETGVFIDTALVVSRLGPPLEDELANWFPASDVAAMAARYREMYAGIAVPATVPMPGAAEAIAAVQARGRRVMVVTAKNQRDAERTIRFLDLPVDHVAGALWAGQKGVALRERDAGIYVGDHIGDVDAARAAAAYSVGIATGPFDATALAAYGADAVLPDLLAFPRWLDESGLLDPRDPRDPRPLDAPGPPGAADRYGRLDGRTGAG